MSRDDEIARILDKSSRTSKVITALFIIFIVFFVSAIGFINYYVDSFMYVHDMEPEDSPFPLRPVNETRAHLLAEGNIEIHNIVSAEFRQAAFHMPFGILGTTRYARIDGTTLSPDQYITNISNWTPDITAYSNLTQALNETRVAALGGLADNPIHTGEYLHAQSLRWATYKQENNEEGISAAELQIMRVIDGFWLLTHASGIPGYLVRVAYPNRTFGLSVENPWENQPGRIYYGNPCPETTVFTKWGPVVQPAFDFSGWMIEAHTSRDQNIGVLFGLASVLKYVENPIILKAAGAIVVEMTEYFIKSDWKVLELIDANPSRSLPNGADFDAGPFMMAFMPQAFLKVASQVNPDKFNPLYLDANLKSNLLITLWNYNKEHNPWSAWYAENLNWQGMWSWMVFEENYELRSLLLIQLEVFYNVNKIFKNAFFQGLYLSLQPENNENSAASNQTKRNRILDEIRDSLARMTDDRWKGFNYYHAPDMSEIAPLTLEDLEDQKAKEIYKKFGKVGDLVSEFVGGEFLTRTYYSLPVDWRNPSDFQWQRSPYNLRRNDINYEYAEQYHADFTIIYWTCRLNSWISTPESSLNLTPQSVSNAKIAYFFGNQWTPENYGNFNTIKEALLNL